MKIDLLIYFLSGLLKVDLLDETIRFYLTEVNHPPITILKEFSFFDPSLAHISDLFANRDCQHPGKPSLSIIPRTECERRSSFKGIW